MHTRAAAPIFVALGLLVWGCAKTGPAAPSAEYRAPLASAQAGIGDPSTAPAPALAQVEAPQVGLGSADEGAPALPPRVQRFVESMHAARRDKLNAAWISAKQASAHLEAVVPAIVNGLTRADTMAQARQLLAKIGPRAAPYVRTELNRLKREVGADPGLQRAVRSLEQLLSGWR